MPGWAPRRKTNAWLFNTDSILFFLKYTRKQAAGSSCTQQSSGKLLGPRLPKPIYSFFFHLLFSCFLSCTGAHQRLFTSESRELILKNKAAVVGRCSICFSMSALYLAAAHLHRSSTARKSLSSPIPAAPTSQCQQRGAIGSWSPPRALHSLPGVCCPARISGAAVMPAAQGAAGCALTGL